MTDQIIFSAGSTPACRYATEYLKKLGLQIVDTPCKNIRYLLLDVPGFQADGTLRNGKDPEQLFSALPREILVCGGNLSTPKLDGFETVDFLKDETYLCENAYITAECALDVALPYLNRTLRRCPVLILGWGRIGKCLGALLQNMGADVTIAARNPGHQAMIHVLGYHSADLSDLPLPHYRLIYNTIPHLILGRDHLAQCSEDCVKIDLASKVGMEGDDIIIARGLPGIHMPESSGTLIAETFLRLCYGR